MNRPPVRRYESGSQRQKAAALLAANAPAPAAEEAPAAEAETTEA